jgi:hypothetical protein
MLVERIFGKPHERSFPSSFAGLPARVEKTGEPHESRCVSDEEAKVMRAA